ALVLVILDHVGNRIGVELDALAFLVFDEFVHVGSFDQMGAGLLGLPENVLTFFGEKKRRQQRGAVGMRGVARHREIPVGENASILENSSAHRRAFLTHVVGVGQIAVEHQHGELAVGHALFLAAANQAG